MQYQSMSKQELEKELENLNKEHSLLCEKKLSLDMSRGKPSREQLRISDALLSNIDDSDCTLSPDLDLRNYGLPQGIPSCKELFAQLLEVESDNVLVCGNSSLNIMYDLLVGAMLFGTDGVSKPWRLLDEVKFLCPVPGYDRHFRICQTLGIKMINVNMTPNGPDMDEVERLVENDESIKGIWCVPKYSNPEGITYSDETVKRFAKLCPKARDFRIFWDNAYFVHDLYDDKKDSLLNLLDELKKTGRENMAYVFASTSKITYPGGGVAALASGKENITRAAAQLFVQTIGHDKINQARHVKFLKDKNGVENHMRRHAEMLRPKFELVTTTLEKELACLGIASFTNPLGGYFVSLDLMDGCAKRTVALCTEAGVKLTEAGATFPYGIDPKDKNIRIAPTYPSLDELQGALEVLCVSAKIATLENLLSLKRK